MYTGTLLFLMQMRRATDRNRWPYWHSAIYAIDNLPEKFDEMVISETSAHIFNVI